MYRVLCVFFLLLTLLSCDQEQTVDLNTNIQSELDVQPKDSVVSVKNEPIYQSNSTDEELVEHNLFDSLLRELIPQDRVKLICKLEESYDDQKDLYIYSAKDYIFKLKVFGHGTWPDAQSANSILFYKNKKLSFDDCKITCFDREHCNDYAFNISNTLNDAKIIRVCGKKFLYSEISFACNGNGCGCNTTMIYDLENNKSTFLENYRINYNGYYISDFDNDNVPDLLMLEQTSRSEKDSITENEFLKLYRYRYVKGDFVPVGNIKTKQVCMTSVKTEYHSDHIDFRLAENIEAIVDSSWFSSNVENYIFYSTQHSIEFLETSKEKFGDDLIVSGDHVVYRGDTVMFPVDLKLHKSYQFVGQDSTGEYILKIERINYSTVIYEYEFVVEKRSVVERSGYADLGSFFLAAEMMEDDEDGGLSFGANEYFAKNDFTFCVGTGKDRKGRLRAYADRVLLRCTPN